MFTHRRLRDPLLLPLRTSVAALLLLGAGAWAHPAQADTSCAVDADCSKGFTCQVSSVSGCPGTPACKPGAACSDAAPPPCTVQTTRSCQPGPCTTDGDCALGMACHADTAESCGASACSAGDECPPPAPPVCQTIVGPSACVPKYQLPCTVDTDCGDHFRCVADVVTTCTGGGGASSGSGAADAGAVVVDVPAQDGAAGSLNNCTTTTLSTGACQAVSIACTGDTACPATWTCAGSSNNLAIGCGGPAVAGDGSSLTIPCEADAGYSIPGQMFCQPPYATTGSGTHGGGTLSAPKADGGTSPAVATGGSTSTAESSGGHGDSGGCQMGGASGSPASGSLVVLAGILGLALRRRPRRGA